jgi:hypothetical protein
VLGTANDNKQVPGPLQTMSKLADSTLFFFQSLHSIFVDKNGFKIGVIKVESNFGIYGTPGNKKCIHLIFEITFEISHEIN